MTDYNKEDQQLQSLSDLIKERKNSIVINKKENRKSKRLVIVLFIFCFLGVLAIGYLQNIKEMGFNGRAVVTQAKITYSTFVAFKVNDMDGSGVSYYYITYRYLVDKDSVDSYFKIRPDLASDFFKKEFIAGDSIFIKYDPHRKIHSEILTIQDINLLNL